MIAPPRLTGATELLDAAVHDSAELEHSFELLEGVNRWLGGRRALLHHLPAVLPERGPLRVLDIGTGGGDLPRAVVDWARARGREARLVAADVHPQVLAIARRRTESHPEISFCRLDARDLPYDDGAFHAALLSMTLHHMDDPDAARVLREMARVSSRGFIVGDLRRGYVSYAVARLLAATAWRHNRLTRHDGPVSVLRSFTTAELRRLGRTTDGADIEVYRHFPYRLILRGRVDAG